MTAGSGPDVVNTGDTGDTPSPSTVRLLLVLSLPSVVIGVVSALGLYVVERITHTLEHMLWVDLPGAIGVDPHSGWWMFLIPSATGLLVGLTIWLVPGHGGQDSATVELIAPPPRLGTVPSIVIVAVLGLAGGVSLGPEAPIIAINTGILVAVFRRVWPGVPIPLVVLITAAGTVGALFGTPIAAALVFTGLVGTLFQRGALWDQLFLPLLAAGAGAVTMNLVAEPSFALALPSYTVIAPVDILTMSVIAVVGAGIGLAAAAVFPRIHAGFRLLRHPVLYVTAGGMLLGLLAVIGGPLTLFKGLAQMGELVNSRDEIPAPTLVVIVVVKVVALLVSAAAGFRGGRIFPAVFIGVAVGVLANALAPGIPLTVAVAGGVLGTVLAVSRDGWIAVFIAVAVTGGTTILPVLCLAVLPTWLLVSRGPELIVHSPHAASDRPATDLPTSAPTRDGKDSP
jgi:H+/Cl- antiporter ClcA